VTTNTSYLMSPTVESGKLKDFLFVDLAQHYIIRS